MLKWLGCAVFTAICGYFVFYGTPLNEFQSGVSGWGVWHVMTPYVQAASDWTGGTMYQEAFEYLRERGFLLQADFSWIVPFGFELNAKDREAIRYLHEAWDYRLAVFMEPNPPRLSIH